jgi:hypothetical protein
MNSREESSFNHLKQLSDNHGLIEHATGEMRREKFGYGTDDCWGRAILAFEVAALGVADVLNKNPDLTSLRALLLDAVQVRDRIPVGPWSWPETRLAYAKAGSGEAIIASGVAGDHEHEFAQQPIEWLRGLKLAEARFMVGNDAGLYTCAGISGAGFGGLQSERLNLDQGGALTFALIARRQRSRFLVSIS